MAILKGITVAVQVDDLDVREYDDDDIRNSSEKVVSKYIEAISGKHFAIRMTVPESYKLTSGSLGFDIFIDNVAVSWPLSIRPEIGASRIGWTQTKRGLETGPHGTELRPWTFSRIKVETEGQGLPARSQSDLQGLGMISVRVFRIRVEGQVQRTLNKGGGRAFDKALSLREKEANKSGSLTHSMKLGKTERSRASRRYNATYVDGKDSPIAVFDFKYRDRRALQGLLVIPRTPSPPPLEERDIESLTQDEMRELIRRQQQRLRDEELRKQRMKRERVDDEEESEVEISEVKRAKTRPFSNGEVIDLEE